MLDEPACFPCRYMMASGDLCGSEAPFIVHLERAAHGMPVCEEHAERYRGRARDYDGQLYVIELNNDNRSEKDERNYEN